MSRAALRLLVIAAVLTCGACTTVPQLENSARLIARPDFRAAADASPAWCAEALKTINRLEYELERK